ncbi:8-amino-7-oxononanoate synthase/2-amino-3-ketobutyrate coenzyme A ligase [Catellatospora sp. TT07R-123]|uniref:aminotransferase class I/II-fold pyridoxal phosphate-dependent enzyme n=1 Tax=Catellatospora sp. TT07R-123 TaxID=2733863 RepID=UPI001B1A2DEB|nr:pyridoxal phosphate-dependent aminotransferase family protein [Catellatospora sp. TT07R-123]GHJ45196.1 8-amino-7-oxononanoate synthase/2-amino-3-ketobutyrate coenzyme A ligase [Catellatospora sp. TT07R-123]
MSPASSGVHIPDAHRVPSTDQLDRLRAGTRMYDAVIEEVDGRRIRIGDHWLVDYASCNYLGFDLDEEIIEASAAAMRRWGTHPGWSRLLGNPSLYPQIEERLTELLGAPDTLVLPTITHIHMSVLPALVDGGTVFVEANAHKTIYDGGAYARGLGARLYRWHMSDPDELVRLLRSADPDRPRVVCLDGVNSMTGNVPDLPALAAICREHDALMYVDDAHGFGVIGERGGDESSPYGSRGNAVVRHCGETYDNLVLIGGFSKAYSALLAFVAAPTAVKEHLKLAAPPYLYSGPSPTASLGGVLAGFDVNAKRGETLRAHLYELTRRVLDHLRDLGVHTPNRHGTPVLELPLADGYDLAEVADLLWRRGVYVTLAAYPLVPRGQVGFRLQLTSAHTHEQVDALNAVLSDLASRHALRPAQP